MPWTAAYQAPPSMEFSRQKYWSGLPFPSLGDLLDPGVEPRSPALQADSLPSEGTIQVFHVSVFTWENWKHLSMQRLVCTCSWHLYLFPKRKTTKMSISRKMDLKTGPSVWWTTSVQWTIDMCSDMSEFSNLCAEWKKLDFKKVVHIMCNFIPIKV